jgi:alpha-D-xyloside xylohydrolase
VTALHHRSSEEVLRVQPWGPNSVRVRVARTRILDDVSGALGEPAETDAQVDGSRLVVGDLAVDLSPDGSLRFSRGGAELLAEQKAHFAWPGARLFTPTGDGYYRLEQRFCSYEDEKVFGMGQRQHGRLDQKGMVLDLVQRNSEVTVPFMVSSRGYGLLWNMPGVGRAEFATNGTRWVADSARQIDYWVTTGSPAEILGGYADATGHSPMMPEWATGFWQSKLRYETQDELLAVAREYRDRGLPLSVIVADYFHWTHLGDWRFDPADWPDPRAMVKELDAMDVRLMVSVWPSVSPKSANYQHMRERGMLVGAADGSVVEHTFPDRDFHGGMAFYDPTSAEARAFVWSRIRDGYHDLGVRAWWLDACEPEIFPERFEYMVLAAGPGREVAHLYPRDHVRGFAEHMWAEGEDEVVCLVRSAWAGSQRYGALLWSGDIPTTFEALRAQIRAGLNVALSGIPWWTTDIGGFHGGDPASAQYRELVIRWFQYGVFCPVTRLHGHREPRGTTFGVGNSGGPNEVWSYGEEAYGILVDQLRLRERLRPYVLSLMAEASRSGLPPMRPLFVDFPADERAWAVEDQFMFGPSFLVAPVTSLGARQRQVYLPAGSVWTEMVTGVSYEGGQVVTADAPLTRIPVYEKGEPCQR